jgi:hypothetical protein
VAFFIFEASMKKQSFTQKEVLAVLKTCARKLGRNPNLRELRAMTGISEKMLWTRFGGLRGALEAAGFKAAGAGFRADEAAILLDWAAAARKLGKMPSVGEYRRNGKFSETPFLNRYGSWGGLGWAFRKFIEGQGNGLERRWRDVLEMIPSQMASPSLPQRTRNGWGPQERCDPGALKADQQEAGRPKRRGGMYLDRPVYGAPLLLPEMAHAPTNELGVMFLFGALARRLGFVVHRIRGKYPDCIAVRETAPGVWQRVRIEFEFDSRNFVKHHHRPGGCDIIVCWKHSWKDVPEGIEVIELKSYCQNCQ